MGRQLRLVQQRRLNSSSKGGTTNDNGVSDGTRKILIFHFELFIILIFDLFPLKNIRGKIWLYCQDNHHKGLMFIPSTDCVSHGFRSVVAIFYYYDHETSLCCITFPFNL